METDRITLQTLASALSVRCKTYRSELSDLPRKNKIPTQSMSTGAYLLDATKTLLRWLTRYPFLGVLEYDEITKKLTRHGFELAVQSQRDTFADNTSEVSCTVSYFNSCYDTQRVLEKRILLIPYQE